MSEVRLTEGNFGPVLTNGQISVAVQLNAGTFSVIDVKSGRAFLSEATT